jgi:S1-C subfamily serine protease
MRKKFIKILIITHLAVFSMAFGQYKNKIFFHSEIDSVKIIKDSNDTISFNANADLIIDNPKKDFEIHFVNNKNIKYKIEPEFVNKIVVSSPIQSTVFDKELDTKSFFILNVPLADTNKTKIKISIASPIIQISDKIIIGYENKLKIYRNVNQLFDPIMGSSKQVKKNIQRAFSKTFYDCSLDEIKPNDLYSIVPSFEIFPTITNFFFSKTSKSYYDENGNKRTRDCQTGNLKIKWIVKYHDKIVFSDSTSATASLLSYQTKELFEYLLNQSALALFINDSTYSVLSKTIKVLEDSLSKSKISLIKRTQSSNIEGKLSIKEAMKAVVTVHDKENLSHGSGFVVSPDGYILTNYHVIEECKFPKVQFENDTTMFESKVVKLDMKKDIALLKIEKQNLPSFDLDTNQTFEIGENVFAIGTPGYTDLSQSVTKGIVSSIRKFKDYEFIQSDVAVNPGNSGGPLLTESGKVLGIVSFYLPPLYGFQGLSFIVPIKQVVKSMGFVYVK